MNPILIINSAPFTLEFVEPITDLFNKRKIPYNLVSFDEIPDKKEKYAGIIISASPRGNDIIDTQLPYYPWLLNYKKPVIGSCHGHQLIGVLHGSSLIINHEAEEGIHTIDFDTKNILFSELKSPLNVEQHHIKSISLPKQFDLLASSEKCKV